MTDPAELLAAETDPDVLRGTLVVVLLLHSPTEAHRHYGDRRLCCKACDDGRSTPKWPCETRALIIAGLS